MNYEYKSIPFSAIIKVQKDHEEVATLYDQIINAQANKGWQLHLIDTITSFKPGGCGNNKDEQISIKVAVFRRERNSINN